MSRKRAKNLLLDGAALDIAEAYCAREGTTLSRVVEDHLRSLGEPEPAAMSPIVQRLRGVAVIGGGRPGVDTYRDYVYGLRIEGDIVSIV